MVSQHALQAVSQHALQQVSLGGDIPACLVGGIPACLAGLQGQRGVSRPTPRREVEESGQEGLQVHTQGGVSQHALRQTPR